MKNKSKLSFGRPDSGHSRATLWLDLVVLSAETARACRNSTDMVHRIMRTRAALLVAASLGNLAFAKEDVKVFVLAGQSNMEGKGKGKRRRGERGEL